jgi:hypothetical protein
MLHRVEADAAAITDGSRSFSFGEALAQEWSVAHFLARYDVGAALKPPARIGR